MWPRKAATTGSCAQKGCALPPLDREAEEAESKPPEATVMAAAAVSPIGTGTAQKSVNPYSLARA